MTEREKLIRALVAVAAVDGRVEPAERQLIDRLAGEWRIEPAIVQEALADLIGGGRGLVVPKQRSAQRQLLWALIRVAAVDGEVGERERALLERFREASGVTPAELERGLARALGGRGPSAGSEPLPASSEWPTTPAEPPSESSTPAEPPAPRAPSKERAGDVGLETSQVFKDVPCGEGGPASVRLPSEGSRRDSRTVKVVAVACLLVSMVVGAVDGVRRGRRDLREAEAMLETSDQPSASIISTNKVELDQTEFEIESRKRETRLLEELVRRWEAREKSGSNYDSRLKEAMRARGAAPPGEPPR